MPANRRLLEEEKAELKHEAIVLNVVQREVVELAIREVCEHHAYQLHAVNVLTSHVHSVVSAPD